MNHPGAAGAGHRAPRRVAVPEPLRVGLTGIVIVTVVALLDVMRQSLKWIFYEPPLPAAEIAGAAAAASVESGIVGFVVLATVVVTRNRLPGHSARAYAALLATIVASTATGLLLNALLFGDHLPDGGLDIDPRVFLPEWIRYALLGALIAGAWLYVSAEAEQAAEADRIAVDAARMAEQVTEARLRMLEAQIEPHFLFNALANVQRLYETDPAAGERMLRSLNEYLGIALPQMREGESTLARELAHVESYLEIQAIRMGKRLAYSIELPPGLARASVPPLMVLTLVENAVKHGLAPARGGGRIDVRVARNADQLEIVVADTGRGFTSSKGAGTGLANTRTRLRMRYGESGAKLNLAMNAPHGVVATLMLPYVDVTEGIPAP